MNVVILYRISGCDFGWKAFATAERLHRIEDFNLHKIISSTRKIASLESVVVKRLRSSSSSDLHTREKSSELNLIAFLRLQLHKLKSFLAVELESFQFALKLQEAFAENYWSVKLFNSNGIDFRSLSAAELRIACVIKKQ